MRGRMFEGYQRMNIGKKAMDTSSNKLINVNDGLPGFSRKPCGKGFAFFDEKDEKITDSATLQRLKSVYIPPAWSNVWICREENGHIQATGFDQKGRKQYVYHPLWTNSANKLKFKKIRQFGEWLPKIRQKAKKDLKLPGWPKAKVLALITILLDEVFIRIGNKSYQKVNGTYGLTTLQKEHVSVNNRAISFEFKAKSGKTGQARITGKTLITLLKELLLLPGQALFKFIDDKNQLHPVTPSDVNNYLKTITGQNFTAKNFRTWKGTVLAIEKYEEALAETTANPRKKLLTALVKKVAQKLGNTVSICRNYYIHPSVLSAIENNRISRYIKRAAKSSGKNVKYLRFHEIVALALI